MISVSRVSFHVPHAVFLSCYVNHTVSPPPDNLRKHFKHSSDLPASPYIIPLYPLPPDTVSPAPYSPIEPPETHPPGLPRLRNNHHRILVSNLVPSDPSSLPLLSSNAVSILDLQQTPTDPYGSIPAPHLITINPHPQNIVSLPTSARHNPRQHHFYKRFRSPYRTSDVRSISAYGSVFELERQALPAAVFLSHYGMKCR